ncbi:uncharacterized protein [Dermacentor andersoni]|uniref:uncharacterized protein n=1 Tax=Dermacentor andersoni TaxID=34620 RepID=UPI002417874F|nr:uncharacterized protein LOC126534773 [Dermacentor andersoni]
MGALKEALAKLPWQTLQLANLSFSTNYWPLVKKVLVGIVESPRDFELVMGWHVVHYAAPITSHELATAYHDIYASSMDAVQKHRRFCFSNAVRFFGVASFSLYVRDHYTPAVREEVESMAKAVRRTYFATLTDSTYDWASLTDTLKYLRRSQSHRVREILDDVGDIHFDIVANYRTMTVAYTKAGEDMEWLLGYELAENIPYPFRTGGEASMLPWAIEFPYYRHDVPAYLRYGSFVTAFARVTAWQHRSHKSEFTKRHESCCRRSAANVSLASINSASAIEASAILYQKARWSQGEGEEASLPDLAHMSPLQLFFVSGCYIFCKRGTGHIPCNAPLRWSADFRKAFQCPPDSPMLANETCPVFSSSGSRPDARST